MWAGAHVRPIPASTPQLKREAQWLKETVVTRPHDKKQDEFLRDWEKTLSRMECGIRPQTEKFLPMGQRNQLE